MLPYMYYVHFTGWCWLAIAAYWLTMARNNKETIRRESSSSRLFFILTLMCSIILLSGRFYSVPWLRFVLVPHSQAAGFAGSILCAAGILFAAWARHTLASNWSGTVTVKKDHELIERGPYGMARHPIYTGAILALTGTFLVSGYLKALLAITISIAGIISKIATEEKFMTEQFPEQYPAYKKRVRMLIPYLF